MHQGRGARKRRFAFDAFPVVDQRVQFALERFRRRVFTDGAYNDATHALGQNALHHLAKALALTAFANFATHADF